MPCRESHCINGGHPYWDVRGQRTLAALAGFDKSAFVGEHSELDAVAEVEFGEDSGEVGLDGRFAEIPLTGDLGVGQSLCDESCDR